MISAWIFLGFLGFLATESLDSLVVSTTNGPVRGVFRERLVAHRSATWWGIRYAEPPVGANRFKEPKAWDEDFQLLLDVEDMKGLYVRNLYIKLQKHKIEL